MDEHNALHSFAHADGSFHLMGCMLSAASCNKWWMDEILKTTEYEREQDSITKLGENHVYYLPYLMGERSPHNDPKARAAFIGMTMDTAREDMTQAVLEGGHLDSEILWKWPEVWGFRLSVPKSAAAGQRVCCGRKLSRM